MPRTPRSDAPSASALVAANYARDVFINCPFDKDYRPLRDAVVFAVFACRLRPRCALESYNGGDSRMEKIVGLIGECQWGIHDLSLADWTKKGPPRFNMPFEFGLFLGAYRFGNVRQQRKSCIVFVRTKLRSHRSISDIAGHDPVAHANKPHQIIGEVRDWLNAGLQRLSAEAGGPVPPPRLPDGAMIAAQFDAFQRDLPRVCNRLELKKAKLTFTDYCEAVREWIQEAEATQPRFWSKVPRKAATGSRAKH